MPAISRRDLLRVGGVCLGAAALRHAGLAEAAEGAQPQRPNIVFILADDLGYGDLGCYGATKIKTPHCDRLAREGVRFTDAHSPSAVCTPTRYAFMTGEYAWRKRGTGILPGIAALIIEPGRLTVPALLQKAGYATGVVGKWHLGLGPAAPTDYNSEIKPGPLEVGFDYAWIIPATGDRTPCVWVENHRVAGLDPNDPIGLDYSVKRGEPKSFVNGIVRIGGQTGGKAALWKDDEIADTLARKADAFIEKNKDKPFFLYLATHDIHVPRVPHARFRGTSKAGVRGDAVHSFDWTVGQVLATLGRLKLADNTLVIVTSDNGGVLDTNGPDSVNSGTVETNNGHPHNGPLRAGKGSAYEGGTRVPFLVRWPGRAKSGPPPSPSGRGQGEGASPPSPSERGQGEGASPPSPSGRGQGEGASPPSPSGRGQGEGAVSGELLCHVDMLATFAALTGQTLPADAAPDSFNVLPALLGEKPDKPCRDHLVEHGNVLAIRMGHWKLIPRGPAGKGKKGAGGAGELYNLADDLGETKNVASQHPDIVKELSDLRDRVRERGRSRP
ncbi:MAG: arylsulfatase [Planctomycetes bacterium]|nr:arylsulfatase [Planctomycetota bacterium]